jgi:hypothetical protein
VLGVSEDWLVVRENLPSRAADTAACAYPGLDSTQYVGATVHFFQRSDEDRRGRLVPLEKAAESLVLYARGRLGEGCSSEAEGKKNWSEIAAHAGSLRVTLAAATRAPAVLGAAVPDKACILLNAAALDKPPCRREFPRPLKAGAIRIAVSLAAIPEAPDPSTCQFAGYRFGGAIAVEGFNFGKFESRMAPGGFAEHYDCRCQQFDPLRLYALDETMVLVGGFSGTNMADRSEHPFVIIFPAGPSE